LLKPIAVSNASPLIALDMIGIADLLAHLYDRVYIPLEVAREIRAKEGGPGTALLDRPWLVIRRLRSRTRSAGLRRQLHAGEAEVIALFEELGADTEAPGANIIIMDDGRGRRVARQLGLPLTGVCGVLLRFKVEGLVEAVGPLLAQLAATPFRLADDLIREVLRVAGEA
jgi:predicted nucleic acid-binding protein